LVAGLVSVGYGEESQPLEQRLAAIRSQERGEGTDCYHSGPGFNCPHCKAFNPLPGGTA